VSAEKKVTILGEESDDGIERESVWIMRGERHGEWFEICSGQ